MIGRWLTLVCSFGAVLMGGGGAYASYAIGLPGRSDGAWAAIVGIIGYLLIGVISIESAVSGRNPVDWSKQPLGAVVAGTIITTLACWQMGLMHLGGTQGTFVIRMMCSTILPTMAYLSASEGMKAFVNGIAQPKPEDPK
ncbi:MAG: hypothetical protein PHT12_05815 [Patescibacteria group bacterium]|nr:hypothetical protein [Patescibacteria group bacterium]